MKKNFSQPFERTPTFFYLLVEVHDNKFLQFTSEEFGALYATTLEFKTEESEDFTMQLCKFLHENGLSPIKYRELAREVSVSYSFLDDTPGTETTDVCIYVRADQTNQEIKGEGATKLLSLDDLLDNFEASTGCAHVLLVGAAQLFNERDTLR